LEINQKHEGKVVILCPVGRIDTDTYAAFQAKLLETLNGGQVPVLCDFSRLEYISSAGLRALMTAAKISQAANGHFAVAALTPMVKEIFKISHFFVVVRVLESVPEAIAAMS
jgi:anti-sigma B factor antagonist